MDTCAVLDGSLGVSGELPAPWRLVENGPTHAVWRTPAGDIVLLEHVPEPVVVDPFQLDDYRHDLRLLAAERGGGLVECELEPRLGLVGVTKERQALGRGAAFRAHALLPTAGGHASLGVLTEEGPVTGAREAGVLLDVCRQRAGGGVPRDWLGDPYGHVYERPATNPEFQRRRWPDDLLLRSMADDPGFDARYPGHPLSRVRALVAVLAGRLRITAPATRGPPDPIGRQPGLEHGLPAGFVGTERGRLARGWVYQRFSFAGRTTFLSVRRRPGGAAAGRDLAAAQELAAREVAGEDAEVVQGPRLVARGLGARRGVYLEQEVRTDARPLYQAGFVTPWGADAVDVVATTAPDDWARANRHVEQVVESLRPTAEAPPDPAADVSDNGLRRIYGILCRLARCDGQVDRSERDVLEAYRIRYGLDRTEAADVEVSGGGRKTVSLGRAAAERDALLEAVIEVVVADGIFDPEEQKRVARLARGMGLPEAELMRRVSERLA